MAIAESGSDLQILGFCFCFDLRGRFVGRGLHLVAVNKIFVDEMAIEKLHVIERKDKDQQV